MGSVRASWMISLCEKKNHLFLAKQAFNAYTGFKRGAEFKGDKDSANDKTNLTFPQLIQTTGSAVGSKPDSKTTKTKKTKKRSLAEILVNANPTVAATSSTTTAASGSTTNSAATSNFGTALTSTATAETSSTPREPSQKKQRKKARTTDEHFKSDYKDLCIVVLSKLIRFDYKEARLNHKERCVILWEVSNQFHRDTKKFDSKTALKAEIEEGCFRDRVVYCYDDWTNPFEG